MPSKRKKSEVAPGVAGVTIPLELLDQLVRGPMTPEEVQAACLSFKKALIERAMGAEMTHHLGYRPGEGRPDGQDNHRNGTTAKTVLTDDGPVRLDLPRDRDGSYEPILIPKHERRFTGFDDKIIAMYALGMTVREIQSFLAGQYGTEVSPEFISSVTDEVMAEVTAWQNRPLEPMYPVIFFDALRVKIREDADVRNKAVYLALGVLPNDTRDVLGIWIEQTEGAKFWLAVARATQRARRQGTISAGVARGHELVRHPLWRQVHRDCSVNPRLAHGISDTPNTNPRVEAITNLAALPSPRHRWPASRRRSAGGGVSRLP